jgi:hypothetical protein
MPSSSTCSGAGVLGACSRTTSACRGRECLPLLQGLAHGDGTWEHIHTALRQRLRRLLGREPTPSAAIIDSQRVGQGVRHAVFTRPFRTSVTVGLRTKHHLVPVEVIAEEGAGSVTLEVDQQEVESAPTYATPHSGPDEELQDTTREHYGYL